jgi:hypothetical protein
MYERMLNRIRQLVLERRYVVTLHAYDEMAADGLGVWDVEAAILRGNVIEQQRDRDTAERKYRVTGTALDNRQIEVVVKVGPTGKLVIVTAYAL